MEPLEALADAVMQYEGWFPRSRSWRNRSPGNLRPYSLTQQQDGDGYRVFQSLADGWLALRLDLQSKFNGSHGLSENSTMLALLNVYAPAGDANNPTNYTTFICNVTSKILGRTISPTTTLKEYLG